MAENMLTGGVASPAYPTFQPMQQANPLAQVSQAAGVAGQLQGLQQQQFQIGKQRLDYLHDQMGALAAKPDVSFQDVTNVATNLIRMGYPPDQVSQELAQAPKDSAGIKAWATQHMAGIANHAQRLEMGYGSQGAIGTGGGTQFFRTSPLTPGVVQGGTFVQHTLSPEAASAPTPVPDAQGNTNLMTRQQFSGSTGTGQGGLAGSFQPPKQAQEAQQPTNAMPGVPGPGAAFGPNLDAYNKDMAASSDLAKAIRTSGQALQLADALGTTGTGPGTKPFNDAKAFLESVGIKAPDDTVSMRNELDKYLQQTVNNSPLAQRSDMGTLATKLGTPNTTEQTNAATRALLRTGIAQAGMDAAVPHAYDWKGNNNTPTGYIVHKGSFTQNQDQQAYALAQGLMQPGDAKALLDKMNALPNNNAQKQKFFTSLENAKKAKIVNLPGLTNASGQ